jgi:hypothetical protein
MATVTWQLYLFIYSDNSQKDALKSDADCPRAEMYNSSGLSRIEGLLSVQQCFRNCGVNASTKWPRRRTPLVPILH